MATNELAAALRAALEAGNFEGSATLARQYRSAISRDLREAASEGDRAAIAREAISFLEDRLHLARVLRAHVASRLATAFRAQTYCADPPGQNIWQLEA